MKKYSRFLLVAMLICACVLALAGCGKKGSTVVLDKNTVYSEQIINIPFEKGLETNTIEVAGDRVYFCGYVYNDKTYETKNKWGYASLDGSEYKSFDFDTNDGWVDSMLVLKNGNLALFYSDYFEDDSDPDNYIWESYFNVALYDKDGKFIKKLNLTDEYGIEWMNSAKVIDDKSFMVITYESTIIFDNELNVVKVNTSESGSEYYNFYTLKDGRMFTFYWGEEGTIYKYYDPMTNTAGDELDVSKVNLTNYSIMQGNENYDILLTDAMGVYGYNLGDAEITPIMNYINSDSSATWFTTMEAISGTEFVGCFYDWDDEESRIKVAKYTKVDPSSIKDKTTISLGCLYMDDAVRKNVIKFNKSSDEYRIVIVDYSKYDTEDDWEAGTNKFNSDIASGQGPDIIVSNGSQLGDYYSKGLFVDLLPLIEKDSELSKEDLFPNLIEACSKNGKLYEVVPYFYIQSLAGKTSLLGGKTSWTFDEFDAFRKTVSPDAKLFGDMDRSTLLYYFLSTNTVEYVDMANGKCYFDTPEFVSLLKFLKDMPEEQNYEVYDEMDWEDNSADYRTDKAILSTGGIYSIRDYTYTKNGTFGEDITYIGYPSKSGNGSSIYYSESYAISSKCKNVDAAWQILRYYLTDEFQSGISYGIPASIKRFDELAEEAKHKPYWMDGDEKVEYDDTIWINGQSIPIDPATDEDMKKLKDFILSVTKKSGDVGDIETIIDEEAAAFFEGQKTAEEVAKLIQSRASIYISEKQ